MGSMSCFWPLKHKRQEALVFLVGFVILFLTLVNDILYSNLLVKTGHMIQFGLFVFIFSQAFLSRFKVFSPKIPSRKCGNVIGHYS